MRGYTDSNYRREPSPKEDHINTTSLGKGTNTLIDLEFDPEAGCLYIRLNKEPVETTKALVKDSVYIDYDGDGNAVGIEFLKAKTLKWTTL